MISLEKIIITGFKGICNSTTIPAKRFNVIVGKNDAGKSTVLKALDLFLNNRAYVSEYLNNRTAQYSQIELVFSANDTHIIIDENTETTFEDEGLVNEQGYLHIVKRWDGTKDGKISPEYSIKRQSFGEADFFSLTEAKLIKLCEDNCLDAEPGLLSDPRTGIEHNNTEKRKRLREIYLERSFDYEIIEDKLPSSGQTRLKKTEIAIKQCLPKFEYFLADAPLSESDSSIQKYFKDMAFKVIKDEVDTEALEIAVRDNLQTVLDAITTKINAVVPENEQVQTKVDFDWSKLITTSFESDNGHGSIPLSARGDGFRRITMMAYFEYLAEERSHEHQNIIFGFEEPETFLHPSAQEKLFEKLNDISKAGYQVFLTTHSPTLVSKSQKDDLLHIVKEQGSLLYTSDGVNYETIANDLGITVDNIFIKLFDNAKCLLLVEGIDDCNALNYVSSVYCDNGVIDNKFEDMGVVLIPVGGCGSIKHWVSLNLLQTLNKPYYVFLDSDKHDEVSDSPNALKLTDYGLVEGEHFSVTKKRELENYMSPVGLERLVPNSNMSFTDWCDVKQLSKSNEKVVALGGKRIADKHFTSLTYDEIESMFNPGNNDDEFLSLYGKISELSFQV